MIQDTDEDILNSDFLKWAVSIKQSFRYQIKDNIRKRIISMQTAIGESSSLFPFTTCLYVQYRSTLSKLFVPLSIPLDVFVISAHEEDIEYCINSAFDILSNKMRSGFEVVGNSENTHDYRYFFPITSASVKVPNPNFDLKTDQSMSVTYKTKDMKTNLFEDTYKILQRGSLL